MMLDVRKLIDDATDIGGHIGYSCVALVIWGEVEDSLPDFDEHVGGPEYEDGIYARW